MAVALTIAKTDSEPMGIWCHSGLGLLAKKRSAWYHIAPQHVVSPMGLFSTIAEKIV